MSESKKNRFMNFLKFLVIKVKPSCANAKRSQSEDEMIDDEIEIESQQTDPHLITLPDHLIVDHILPRLPAKAVFRYKSVCKHWHSVISNPEFAKLHLTCSFSRPQFLLFEDHHSTDKLHMHFLHNADKGLVALPFVDDGVYPAVELVGSCNGLICLHVMALDGTFLVWNPAIRQNRYIIDPYHQELITGYGFGYASSTYDYKIVASYSSILDREMGRFYVFSSKAGVWKRIQSLDGSHYAGELTRFQGVLIGDTLYWPTRNFKAKGVVGFSLVDYQLQQVPGTEWLIEYDKTDIFEIKGRLSLWCYRSDEGSDVWTLRRHGVANCWETLFSIDTKGISVLRFTKTGNYLVQHDRKLRLLDPRKEDIADDELSQEGVDFHVQIKETCDYVDTLTPPFGLPGYDGGDGESSDGSNFNDDYLDELQSFSLYA